MGKKNRKVTAEEYDSDVEVSADTQEAEDALDADVGSESGAAAGNGITVQEAADLHVEDGFDIATHGGGSLERIEGFDVSRSMTEGFSPQYLEVDDDLSEIPASCTLEFETPESVCGRDDRVRITATTRIPWRMICQLFITRRDDRVSRCTGWFISPGTVMTAGHCVYSHSAGGWAKRIEVVPGMNGGARPFGSAVSSRLRSVTGWTRDAKVTHDYGCIILDNKLGNRTGWFGFSALSDAGLRNLLVNNSGYPGDKPVGTQWFNAGRVTRVEARRIHYMLDTAGGQSGSPTWRLKDGKRHAVGVHAYGGCPNKSTRITTSVFNRMKAWKDLGS